MGVLRWIMGIGAGLVLVVFLVGYWHHQRRFEHQAVEHSPPRETFEKFLYQQTRAGQVIFRFRAERYRWVDEDTVEGQGVTVEFPSDEGSTTTVWADRGWWSHTRARIELQGNVRVMWQGLQVHADALTYLLRQRIAEIRVPVTWQWPERRWNGRADRLRYNLRTGRIILAGSVRMRWETETETYRLQTERLGIETYTEQITAYAPVSVETPGPLPFIVHCGWFRRTYDEDGVEVWMGKSECEGHIPMKSHRIKWKAQEIRLWPERDHRRWWLKHGQFNIDDTWWFTAPRLTLTREADGRLVLEGQPYVIARPLVQSQFAKSIARLETAAVVWPDPEGPLRMVFPTSLTIALTQGRLKARWGQYDGQTWQVFDLIYQARDGWTVQAPQASYDGTALVFAGDGDTSVRGTGTWDDQTGSVMAERLVLSEDTMRWEGAVAVHAPTFSMQAATWEWRDSTWQATAIRRGRRWEGTPPQQYEVVFQADRGLRQGTCVRLEGQVVVVIRTWRRSSPIRFQAQKGEFCEGFGRLMDSVTYHTGPLQGTGDRVHIDWQREEVVVQGSVSLKDEQGREARGTTLWVNLATEQIELRATWPRRGTLWWATKPR